MSELLSSSLMLADEYWRLRRLISLFGFEPPPKSPAFSVLDGPCLKAEAMKSKAFSARP